MCHAFHVRFTSLLRHTPSRDVCHRRGRFFGKFEWSAPIGMNFAFNGSRISAWRRQLSAKTWEPEKEKTYSFYYVDENIAAVRSSAGGHILMLRQSSFQ